MLAHASRLVLLVGVCGGLLLAAPASANHPVLVEGESDFDGDGLLGADEDVDSDTDAVFGTIAAALAAARRGANQNGLVTIVTSGRFPERVLLTGENGNVQLEAAPGVDARIDAVLAGLDGNADRQGQVGILVDVPAGRQVVLRNLRIRNWLEGIRVVGSSRVVIEDCNLDQNANYGIRVIGDAVVMINDSTVSGTGFRVGAAGDLPGQDVPQPGIGIAFQDNSSGSIGRTNVFASFSAGIADQSEGEVGLVGHHVFGNQPDLKGFTASRTVIRPRGGG